MAIAWTAFFGILGAICIFITSEKITNFDIVVSTIVITIAWVLLHFIGAIHYANIQYGDLLYVKSQILHCINGASLTFRSA